MSSDNRRKPGEVRDAIVEFLRKRRGDASGADIRSGVEAALGTPVAASSVRSYLQLNEGTLFERTARGRYRLKE
jgi:site-specific DNA-methyltransferase (adenine-specific)